MRMYIFAKRMFSIGCLWGIVDNYYVKAPGKVPIVPACTRHMTCNVEL